MTITSKVKLPACALGLISPLTEFPVYFKERELGAPFEEKDITVIASEGVQLISGKANSTC